MQQNFDQDILDAVLRAYPIFLQSLPYNIGVTITDREKYLVYKPADRLQLNLPVGQQSGKAALSIKL